MTKDILQIVPYISKHGKIILANQMNHVLMDKDAQFEGEAMELEQTDLMVQTIIDMRGCFNELASSSSNCNRSRTI